MELRKLSETAATVTLEWEPPAGVEWYVFFAAGVRVSNAAPVDRNGVVKSTVRFSKGADPYEVVAIVRRNGVMSVDVGVFDSTPEPPPPPPPPTSGMPARDLTAWLAQSSIAALPVQSAPLSSWDGNPRAGTLLKVTGAGSVSQAQAARLCSWRGAFAAVQLDTGARFGDYVPMSASGGRRNLAVFGGQIVGSPTYGLLVSAATSVQWWGLTIRDCKRTGLLVHQNVGPNANLDLAIDISGCGFDLAADPHQEKGTGFHAAYLGSSDQSLGPTRDSKFALWVHDQHYGAAAQIGNDFQNNRLWVDARRVTFRAQSQVAGNAFQWWTKSIGSVTGNVVEHVYGEDLGGRLSETDGGWDPGNRILVGRYRNVRLSPVCAPGVPCDDLQAV
jgi:hypothetical protein